MGPATINCANCGQPNWYKAKVCQHCLHVLKPPFNPIPPITKDMLLKKHVIKEV